MPWRVCLFLHFTSTLFLSASLELVHRGHRLTTRQEGGSEFVALSATFRMSAVAVRSHHAEFLPRAAGALRVRMKPHYRAVHHCAYKPHHPVVTQPYRHTHTHFIGVVFACRSCSVWFVYMYCVYCVLCGVFVAIMCVAGFCLD